ncbi:MAG: ribosomal-protein-alanine N-acetyltransferase [Urechidicola sp.]|jgi:ribosomal-protein-alanine N-acetyltransferase
MNYLLTGEETERLSFRLLNNEDYDSWLPLFERKNVAKFLLLDHSLSQKELCDKWFEKSMMRYEKKLGGMNVFFDKVSGEFIGQCGLLIQNIEDVEYLEVGYSILPTHWNRGYASEAAIKCKNFAFENDLTDSLISIIHKENIGSRKVAINNGMSLFKNNLKNPNTDFDMYRISK